MGVKVRQIPKDSGNWYVVVTHRGERRAQKMSSEEKAEKKAEWVRKRLGSLSDNEVFTPTKKKPSLTLGEYADTWEEGHVETNLKWNTKRYYADMLQRVPEEMKARPLAEITRDDVRKLAVSLLEKGLSRSTAAGLLRTLSAIFNAAVEDGVYRGANPALRPGRILRVDNGKDVEESAETDCLNQEEAKHFLEVVRQHFATLYPLMATALQTAARQGEIIGLEWGHVDWKGRFITIRQTAVNGELQKTKNRKRRRVPITPHLVQILKDHRQRARKTALAAGKSPSQYLFPSPTGALMDPSKLRRELRAILDKARVRHVDFHSLRHTALTAMAENGVPMVNLQRIAGHSSIQVTAQYYLHTKPEAHQDTLKAMESLYGGSASKMRVEAVEAAENPVSV